MPLCCAVPMCSQKKGGHKFPKDKIRLKQWLKAIRRDRYKPTIYSVVCRDHFSKDDYLLPMLEKSWPGLKKDAVPSRFPWNEATYDLLNHKRKTRQQCLDRDHSYAHLSCSTSLKSPANIFMDKPSRKSNLLAAPINVDKIDATHTADSEQMEQDVLSRDAQCRACQQEILAQTSAPYIHKPWASPGSSSSNTIALDLIKLTQISISETDPYSKRICQDCCVQLYNACQFVKTVQETDQAFRKVVPKSERKWPKPIQVEKNINGDMLVNVEIKQEVLSEDECYQETNLADVEIKVEPEEMIRPQVTTNGTGSNATEERKSFHNEEYLESGVKEEPMSEDETELLDLSLDCMLCSKEFNCVSGLKAHVIAQHSYKGVKRRTSIDSEPEKQADIKHVCATCRRTFTTSTDLMVHETCHNKSVCYGCNKKFDNFKQLIKHRKRCKACKNNEAPKLKTLDDAIRHIPDETQIKTVEKQPKILIKCTRCDEVVSGFYYMKLHDEIHHSNDIKSDKQTKKEGNSKGDEHHSIDENTYERNAHFDSNDVETEALKSMLEDEKVINSNDTLGTQSNDDQKSVDVNIKLENVEVTVDIYEINKARTNQRTVNELVDVKKELDYMITDSDFVTMTAEIEDKHAKTTNKDHGGTPTYKEHDSIDNIVLKDANIDQEVIDDSVIDRKDVKVSMSDRIKNNDYDSMSDRKEIGDTNIDQKEIDSAKINRKEFDELQEVDDAIIGRKEIDDDTIDRKEVVEAMIDREETDDAIIDRQEIDVAMVDGNEVDDAMIGRKDVDDSKIDLKEVGDDMIDREQVYDATDDMFDRKSIDDSMIDQKDVCNVIIGRVMTVTKEVHDAMPDRIEINEEMGDQCLQNMEDDDLENRVLSSDINEHQNFENSSPVEENIQMETEITDPV